MNTALAVATTMLCFAVAVEPLTLLTVPALKRIRDCPNGVLGFRSHEQLLELQPSPYFAVTSMRIQG